MTVTGVQPRTVHAARHERGDDRFYEYPPTGEQWPSVTTITSGTSAKPWLPKWHTKIAATYAVTNIGMLARLIADTTAQAAIDLADSTAGLGADLIAARAAQAGKDAAVKLIKEQAGLLRDLKADTGSHVHNVVEHLVLWAASPEGAGADVTFPEIPEHLRGSLYDEEPIEAVIDWMVTGFTNWVTDFGPEFIAAEMPVFNPDLKVAGTLDMIAALHGRDMDAAGDLIARPGHTWTPCIDVKTGRNLDNTVKEQLATYRRMTEALLPMGELVAMPPTDAAAVLHLRPEYSRGYRFEPVSRRDDALAWNRFRRAYEVFTGRAEAGDKPGRPAYPLRPDGTVPSRRLEDLDGEGYDRAPGALARAGVDDLELLASLTEDECLALKGIGPKSLPHIHRILADHGLQLASATPDPLTSTGKAA